MSTENQKNSIASITALLIFAGIMIGVLLFFMTPPAATELTLEIVDGHIESDIVDISSKIPGKLKNINVKEGDEVKKGELLAVIDSQELYAKQKQAQAAVNAAIIQKGQGETALRLEKEKNISQIEQAEGRIKVISADIEMAKQKLKALTDGARPQEKKQAQAAVNAAQSVYDTATKTYARIKSLADDGVIAEQKADEALMAKNSAKAQLEAAQAKLSLAQEGSRKEEIKAAESQIEELNARLEVAQSALRLAKAANDTILIKESDVKAAAEKIEAGKGSLNEVNAYIEQTKIYSPASGRITKIMMKEGELAAAGFAIMSISSQSNLWVDLYIDETLFAGHSIGEKLTVEIPALNQKVGGTITKVLPAADFATKKANNEKGSFDTKALQLRLTLDSIPSGAVNGMTARVSFNNKGVR